MSEAILAPTDPFDLPALEEGTELRTLARALQLAAGFKLYFVRCNQPQQRRRVIASLRAELPQLNVQEIQFSQPMPHLLDALRQLIEAPAPDAVFVSGLEYSLPIAEDADATPFVANLNAARNSFPNVVPCPLVLWVPEYVLVAIARGAPDFFSVRSGVHFLDARPSDTVSLLPSTTARQVRLTTALSLEEKKERIADTEDLLAKYQGLAREQRDLRTEAQLHWRLGNLLETLGSYAEVAQHYERTRDLARQLNDRMTEAAAIGGLGGIYTYQGKWSEAEAAYRQSLDILRDTGNRLDEAAILRALGVLYQAENRLTEAQEVLLQSAAIFRGFGDRVHEAQELMNLSAIYAQQGRLTEAESACQQCLTLLSGIADRVSRGVILAYLGLIYHAQGRLPEAEAVYHEALEYCHAVSDRLGEATSLANLGLLREAQGDAAEALRFGRQSLAVLETTEETQVKAAVERLLERLEESGNSEPAPTPLPCSLPASP
jgi:tetratricopeptide (TPR) repeat protein